ncbi:hypothetical protein XENORESO_016985 [Xenotaenia resolanae]|uniref:Uncharacterized protein n=1 Tax=Xenotaenia resolanae TaxID=208358 RepID=A0ABV0VKT8_9TELE
MSFARAPSIQMVYTHNGTFLVASARQENPVHCPVSVVLSFLQELLTQGRSPSILWVYLTAISCWDVAVCGKTIGRTRMCLPQRHLTFAPTRTSCSACLGSFFSPCCPSVCSV